MTANPANLGHARASGAFIRAQKSRAYTTPGFFALISAAYLSSSAFISLIASEKRVLSLAIASALDF